MEGISTPQEWEVIIGENLKALRLLKNLDRKSLCLQAGVSETALRNLEGGMGSTLKTLIRVAKALNRESWLSSLAPQITVNPLHMVRENQPRQRASRRSYAKK